MLDDIAWFCGNAGDTTHPVTKKNPNGWGLHDLLGNVWEWCWDRHGDYPADPPDDDAGPQVGAHRVVRGGSWSNNARVARAAFRSGDDPACRDSNLGFRPLRSIP